MDFSVRGMCCLNQGRLNGISSFNPRGVMLNDRNQNYKLEYEDLLQGM